MKKRYFLFILILTVLMTSTSRWFGTAPERGQGITASKAKHAQARLEKLPSTSIASKFRTNNRLPSSHDISQVQVMAKVLSNYSNPSSELSDLLDYLRNTNQNPSVIRNSSGIGEMHIVRTKSPTQGSRYFHAQYFTNEAGKPALQHMSVEFKGGERAMTDVVSAMQIAFNVSSAAVEKPDYHLWNLPNGYILWVKKLDSSDLLDNPFNAYSSADIGTIRVAVEQEIH